MKKNNFNDSSVNVDFIEEVDDNLLYDKKNISDIIYEKSSFRKVRSGILLILSIVLILLSLFSIIFGLVYFNKVYDETNNSVYTLFVTHSNNLLGGKNISFEEHVSYDNAYEYNFVINNINNVNMDYVVQIENLNFDKMNVDYTKINYVLVNYDQVVAKGVIGNDKLVNITKLNIDSNTIHNLDLKLWSNVLNKEFQYSFKVNIIG